jgi:methylenetetrahydrofolate reductase (NADPH)
VANILCLTGDGVQAGDQPGAKPVFDFDCMSLLATARRMRDKSEFLSGRKLDYSPKVFLGAASNPFAEPLEFRVDRLAKKVAAGADYVQTQYCYDIPRLKRFMDRVRERGLDKDVFILVGVGPLASARAAGWIRDHVPGVHIPDAVIERLAKAEKPKLEGKRICIELIQEIREIEGVAGVHLMAYRQEESVAEIVDASGILEGRVPWHPNRTSNTETMRLVQ